MAAAVESTRTYRGNCHCGLFVFEATTPEIKEVTVCNCSICYKKNYALHFVESTDFKIIKGDLQHLTTYNFASKSLDHMFCPTCGVAVVGKHANMPGKVAFSIRAIQGPIDVWNLPKKLYDGKAVKPDYVVPSCDDVPDPRREVEGGRVFHGSCHCGGVRVAARMRPVEEAENVTECNCSTCHRSGATWIYPHRDEVVVHASDPSLLGLYPCVVMNKQFCKKCGIFVACHIASQTDEEFVRLPEGARLYLADKREMMSVNLRIFPDVDVGKINVNHVDGWSQIKPAYVNP